jgi:hypothetical protein
LLAAKRKDAKDKQYEAEAQEQAYGDCFFIF